MNPNTDTIKKLIEATLEKLGKVCPACLASVDGPTWTMLHQRPGPHPCQKTTP